MKIRLLIILTIFAGGCGTTLKVIANTVPENFKAVFVLSTLIQDHLRNTKGGAFNLDQLIHNDTLKRVSNSFEKIQLIHRGGHIAVYYKLSNSGDTNKVELTEQEREIMNNLRWTKKKSDEQYDGQIQFDHGERFYRIKKVIINTDGAGANKGYTQ